MTSDSRGFCAFAPWRWRWRWGLGLVAGVQDTYTCKDTASDHLGRLDLLQTAHGRLLGGPDLGFDGDLVVEDGVQGERQVPVEVGKLEVARPLEGGLRWWGVTVTGDDER